MVYAALTAGLLIGISSGVTGATPANPGSCEIAIPDLPDTTSYGTLQLPDGSTVSGERLQTYSGPYFVRARSSIEMIVPKDGIPTPHSKYIRTELKENRTWGLDDGCAGEAARVEVTLLPKSQKIVIGQIHQEVQKPCAPRPPVELVYDDGAVYAEVLIHNTCSGGQPRKRLNIASGLLKRRFSYSIVLAKGGELSVTVNGLPPKTMQLDKSFDQSRLYFKAGNYTQDLHGPSSVTFFGLAIKHGQ
jgi:hypothetical protein